MDLLTSSGKPLIGLKWGKAQCSATVSYHSPGPFKTQAHHSKLQRYKAVFEASESRAEFAKTILVEGLEVEIIDKDPGVLDMCHDRCCSSLLFYRRSLGREVAEVRITLSVECHV
jgi:hypothetical protein